MYYESHGIVDPLTFLGKLLGINEGKKIGEMLLENHKTAMCNKLKYSTLK